MVTVFLTAMKLFYDSKDFSALVYNIRKQIGKLDHFHLWESHMINKSTLNIKCYFVLINADTIQDVAFHNIVVMRSKRVWPV